MFHFVIGFGAGTIFGIICAVILLCKKNAEMYMNLQKNVSNNINLAKNAYEGYVAQELGEDDSSDSDATEELAADDESEDNEQSEG